MLKRGWMLLVGLAVAAGTLARADETPIAGFFKGEVAAERAREAAFRALPSAARMDEYHVALTKEPHHAGSPAQWRTAQYYHDRLVEWGYDAQIYEYRVLVPYPKEREITLVAPEPYTLKLDEDPIPEDPFSTTKFDPIDGALPAYNAYSPSGDVTGELVYVNYGMPEDYDKLAELGVDLRGKIVLARYGAGWRGIKPKVAAEHGAIGCLIYSDPKDDGYVKGDVYPKGPWRPESAVQRGSVMDMPLYPGDPLTPDRPSKPGVKRLRLEDARTLARVPVQPIAYRDALPLLRAIAGPAVPQEWQGGLPLTYHIGPGPARLHMKLVMDYQERPVWNVIGWMRGSARPDEWVIAGGHRDAWTFGGRDPISGAVSLLETARGIAELAKQGYRPRRTIAFASWDGEDFGLLGSTEWVEEFARELGTKGVLYINRESYTAGPFSAEGSHSLVPLLYSASREIPDPAGSGRSLYDAWLEASRKSPRQRQGRPAEPTGTVSNVPPVGALGSGSDYTAFLDHVGVTSLDLGFEGANGLYHSFYDDHTSFTKYGDAGYKYGVILAQLVGTIMLRVAGAEVIPFDYEAYGSQVLSYLDEVDRLAQGDARAQEVPLALVRQRASAFRDAGARLNARIAALTSSGGEGVVVDAINAHLMRAERDLLDPQGLPDRPWFRHQIYAPGLYTGYAVKTLPGVREALEPKNYARAAEQARRLADALDRATRTLDAAAGPTTPSGPALAQCRSNHL